MNCRACVTAKSGHLSPAGWLLQEECVSATWVNQKQKGAEAPFCLASYDECTLLVAMCWSIRTCRVWSPECWYTL